MIELGGFMSGELKSEVMAGRAHRHRTTGPVTRARLTSAHVNAETYESPPMTW